MSEETKNGKCECCGFETELKNYPYTYRIFGSDQYKEERWMCKLCSGTLIGNSIQYTSSYEHSYNGKASLYAANVILDALKKQSIQLAIDLLKMKSDNLIINLLEETGFNYAIEYLESLL